MALLSHFLDNIYGVISLRDQSHQWPRQRLHGQPQWLPEHHQAEKLTNIQQNGVKFGTLSKTMVSLSTSLDSRLMILKVFNQRGKAL